MEFRWISIAFAFVLLAATALAGSMFSLGPSAQDAAPQRGEGEAVASISGVVTDQSGAFRANATVTLSSKERDFERRISTNEQGDYMFEGLPRGLYELKVELQGFRVRYFRRIVIGPTANTAEEQLWESPILRPAPNRLIIPVELKIPSGITVMWVTAKAGHTDPLKTDHPAAPPLPARGKVETASKCNEAPPDYPEEARAKGTEGTVELEYVISPEGVPLKVTVMDSTDEVLARAATKAVRQWRCWPVVVSCGSECSSTIRFKFELTR